mgnify:CR=1 FL=1|uniref:Uncharacterized protein n=1 Tax=Ignisphaera aggregans TaxID=334771 RepID=A0A7J3Z5B0_9CREN
MLLGSTAFYLIDRLPELHRFAVLRTSVLVLMRELNPGAVIYLVIPESCYVETVRKRFMVKTVEEYNIVNETMQKYMNEALKINLVFSPPQNLDTLVDKVLGKRLAVDIDIDYLEEFRTECYSPSPADPAKCKLGNLQQILIYSYSKVIPYNNFRI